MNDKKYPYYRNYEDALKLKSGLYLGLSMDLKILKVEMSWIIGETMVL